MEKILMGGIVAFVLLAFISYVFIVLNVPFLIILSAGLLLALAIKPLIAETKKIKIKFNLQTIIILVVFSLGIAGQLAVISPSGTFRDGDLLFWSSHGHDGAWHIALMEEIKKGYPFQNPVFAGEKLFNYHFFSDILPAMVSKYLPISSLDLYFRIFPFFYSLFLGASAYFLTKKITNNFSASIWATIFTYFAGSFGFIATYLKNKSIGGESIFWATQPQSSSGNSPQIISNFLVLTALYFLITLLQKKGGKAIFAICVLLFGTLSAFKIYAGVVLLGALSMVGVWQLTRERSFQLLLLSILSGTLAAVLYFPNTSGSTSFLIFQPWWYIRTMIVEPSRLNLIDWELRRQTYIYEHNLKRVIFLEGLGFLIFFFGNLGMRFIGIWDFVKQTRTSLKNYSSLVFISTILVSLVLPLLFLQRGVASNTSQFLQYFVLLFGILGGISTDRLLQNQKIKALKIIIAVVIILLAMPTQAGLLYEFYSHNPYAKISKAEFVALSYLRNNKSLLNKVILTPPYDQYLNLGAPVPNIWDWYDTAYVSAFSGLRSYFDDKEQVDIMGYNYRPRLKVKEAIFTSKDPAVVKENLTQTHASLLYFPKSLSPKVGLSTIGLTKLFENQEVEIWKI